MNAELIYTFKEKKDIIIILKKGSIFDIDKFTSNFDTDIDLREYYEFQEKVGVFDYDNYNDIVEDNLTPMFYIRTVITDEDLKIMKKFIDDEDKRVVYLSLVYNDSPKGIDELEEFIKDNSFPAGNIFLSKVKDLERRYLYLRIYEDYILKKMEKSIKKKG